jgi:PAS domain-containing protein
LLCREKNRGYAKKSRLRKKFFVDSLQESLKKLKEDNVLLKQKVKQDFSKEEAEQLLSASSLGITPSVSTSSTASTFSISSSSSSPAWSTSSPSSASFDHSDTLLVKAIQTAQHSFLLTDPVNTPDNHIIYASQNFLDLTGYQLHEVLGRNCRFLQGLLSGCSLCSIFSFLCTFSV